MSGQRPEELVCDLREYGADRDLMQDAADCLAALVAERDRYKKTLEDIAGNGEPSWWQSVARAALAGEAG